MPGPSRALQELKRKSPDDTYGPGNPDYDRREKQLKAADDLQRAQTGPDKDLVNREMNERAARKQKGEK